ncbi:MAG: DNA-processing protein DprA [Muribaculaceae bacterium]|nr:DNA-processing protein DprA [Muribaculaceae bacterium]
MTPRSARIAFSMLGGVNVSTGRELLRRVGSLERVFELSDEEMALVAGRRAAIVPRSVRLAALSRAEREEVFAAGAGVRTLFFCDDGYPQRLLDCDDAPAMLYALGNTPLDAMRTIAIVGTRHCSAYGLDFTARLVGDLAAMYGNVAIVSGLAYGIDVAAHRAALREGLPTVGVMANPLDTVYPAEHRDVAARMVRDGGMLLSEYPTGTRVHRGFFLARNRIVAGLADATVVVESDTRGGAMATARLASAYGRELFAVPGRVTDVCSRGCLDLLARGEAAVVRGAEDIGDALGWKPRSAEGTQQELPLELPPVQQSIADHLRSHPDATANDMCVALGMGISVLTAALFEMEMADVVAPLPGGHYMLTGI